MLESVVALLVVVVLIALALAYFEMTDLLVELVGGVVRLIAEALRLIAGLLFAAGAFFVYLVTRRGREKEKS
jgi:hypothetical protein